MQAFAAVVQKQEAILVVDGDDKRVVVAEGVEGTIRSVLAGLPAFVAKNLVDKERLLIEARAVGFQGDSLNTLNLCLHARLGVATAGIGRLLEETPEAALSPMQMANTLKFLFGLFLRIHPVYQKEGFEEYEDRARKRGWDGKGGFYGLCTWLLVPWMDGRTPNRPLTDSALKELLGTRLKGLEMTAADAAQRGRHPYKGCDVGSFVGGSDGAHCYVCGYPFDMWGRTRIADLEKELLRMADKLRPRCICNHVHDDHGSTMGLPKGTNVCLGRLADGSRCPCSRYEAQ